MNPSSRRQELDTLLQTGIQSLDISAGEYEAAVSRYRAVGRSLARYWDDSPDDGVIYPQGSMRLGTVTRNIHRDDEIDIDLVARRDLAKEQTTQAELKADTGDGLRLFVSTRPEGSPKLDQEGKRCWTLNYQGFHLDVLPALPDQDAGGTGILVTDRELRLWQSSNPIGYADWFHGVMRDEWLEQKGILAKRMDILTVPEWTIKTTLQQTVQALKRHRDLYFHDSIGERPASVLITTLAARAYRSGGSLLETLVDISGQMAGLVEFRDGRYVVCNPVQPKENFADRWVSNPERAGRFFEWIEVAALDFSAVGTERGMDRILAKMAGALGERAARVAEQNLGRSLYEQRRAGTLTIARGTGTIAVSAGVGIATPNHNFHGSTNK